MDPIMYWTRATEAGPEDLTTTTSDLMKRAGSATNAPDDQFAPPTTSDETMQENAAGTERGAMSGNMDAVTPDDGMGGMDDMGMGMDDGMGGGGNLGMGGMGGMDDGMGGGGFGGGGFGGEEENPFKGKPDRARAVYRLYTNIERFNKTLGAMSDSLADYVAPTSSQELSQLYSHCVSHIEECRSRIKELLESDFTPDNYPSKLRKYMACRHVYAGVLEILNLHFKMLKVDQKNQKS